MDGQISVVGDSTLVLTIPEAAAQLRVSPSHIYRLIDAGELVAVKLGQSERRSPRRVTHDSLLAYVERQRVPLGA